MFLNEQSKLKMLYKHDALLKIDQINQSKRKSRGKIS